MNSETQDEGQVIISGGIDRLPRHLTAGVPGVPYNGRPGMVRNARTHLPLVTQQD